MPGPGPRRRASLARGARSVSGLTRARAQASAKEVSTRRAAKKAHKVELIERELSELDEECARVRRLLQRLTAARRARRDAGDILGELGTSVLHLHVHTKGLDELIDELE